MTPKEMFLGAMDQLDKVLENVYFNWLLLGATSVHMILQSMRFLTQDPFSSISKLQDEFDYYMIWVYTGIMCLRVWGKGLLLHPTSFLRTGWCYLDLLVVVCAWLDRVYHFGNVMFFMVLRILKLAAESNLVLLSPLRVITRALLVGIPRVMVVFGVLLFAMVFFGILAVSLIGNPGDFHNRCGISFCQQVDSSGKCIAETWQAIVPAYICRQSNDPIASPQGTCPSTLVGSPMKLISPATNTESAAAILEGTTSTVRCLGPDLQLGKLDQETFATFQGFPPFTEYVPVNYTQWPAVTDLNWDSLKTASIPMFATFYKTAWVQFSDYSSQSTGGFIVIAFIGLIILVSYYLLNLTIAIMNLNFSDEMNKENAFLEASKSSEPEEAGGDDDDGDEEEDDDDDDEQDLTNMSGPRQDLLGRYNGDEFPCCGYASFPIYFLEGPIGTGLDMVANFIAGKIKILGKLKGPVYSAKLAVWGCCRSCCASFNKFSIYLVIPEAEGLQTPFIKVCYILMFVYLCTLAAQNDEISKYKCGCKQIDDMALADRCAIGPKGPKDLLCPLGFTCQGGYCTTEWSGEACVNPWDNPRLQTIPGMTEAAADWASKRTSWCNYSKMLHFVMLGWAGFFLFETIVTYVGHQGPMNFLTVMRKIPEKKGSKKMVDKAYPNVTNILDAICNLITVIGILLTELNTTDLRRQHLALLEGRRPGRVHALHSNRPASPQVCSSCHRRQVLLPPDLRRPVHPHRRHHPPRLPREREDRYSWGAALHPGLVLYAAGEGDVPLLRAGPGVQPMPGLRIQGRYQGLHGPVLGAAVHGVLGVQDAG